MTTDFIGRGWAFPITVRDNGSIATIDGVANIEKAMRIVLCTRLGERPMRPNFGSRLHEFMFDGVSVQYSPRILLTSFRLADRIHAHPNLFFPPAAAEDRARSFCRATPVEPVRQRGAPGVPFKAGTRRDSTDTLWKWRSLPGPTTCAGDRISPSPTRCQTIGGSLRFARSAEVVSTVLHAKAWTRGLTGSLPLSR